MHVRSIAFRHHGGTWLCVTFFTLIAFLTAHVIVELGPTVADHTSAEVPNITQRVCEDRHPSGDHGTAHHSQDDAHCAVSARDVSPTPDLAAVPAELAARQPFSVTSLAPLPLAHSAHPMPPSGRQILLASCTSRT